MIEAVGSKVLKLIRTAIGPIRIGDLQIGKWRKLTEEEVASLSGQPMPNPNTTVYRRSRSRGSP